MKKKEDIFSHLLLCSLSLFLPSALSFFISTSRKRKPATVLTGDMPMRQRTKPSSEPAEPIPVPEPKDELQMSYICRKSKLST